MATGRLSVVRDGVELADEQARALWRAFSEHMERSRGDLDGFARDHGFVAIRAEHRRGKAVLIVWSAASIPPASRRSEPPGAPRPSSRPGTAKGRTVSSPTLRAAGRR